MFVEYQINPGTANFNTDYHAQEKGVLLFKDQEHEAKIQVTRQLEIDGINMVIFEFQFFLTRSVKNMYAVIKST